MVGCHGNWFRRSGLPGWNIIHSGQQGRRGQPHEGREQGLSHIGAQGYRGIEVSGYQDIEISGYRDNRIAGFRGWQACGIGRACGVVKAGGTGGVGRAGGGHVARREVMLPGGRSWCQAGGHGASQESWLPGRSGVGVRGVTIGKDDGVAMVTSLFYPGRVHGVGHGISVDAGYRR